MNTWQVCRQLQYLLRSQNWTGSSTTVFADESVLITAAPRESAIEKLVMPAILIRPLGATTDEEEPDFVTQEIAMTLAVVHAGDGYGEYPLVGGQRTGQTNSTGRGLLEVEEEVFNAIEFLNTDSGVLIQHRVSSAAEPNYVGGQYLLLRDYMFRAELTADRYYHPVENLESS